MKLFITLIAALYLLHCSLAANSRLLQGEGYGEGGKDKDEPLLGGYSKVSKEELDSVIELVAKIEDDVQGLLSVEDDCEIRVLSAQRQVVAGMNYVVNVKSCRPDRDQDVIKFFVDLPVNDPEQMPQNLELMVLNGEDVSDVTDTGSMIVGGYQPVEDITEVEADVLRIDAEIRQLLNLDEGSEITVQSADYQIVADVNYMYRVRIGIQSYSPSSLSLADIQYYKDADGNISNLQMYTETELEALCTQDGFCRLDNLEQIRQDVEQMAQEIRTMLMDAGYTIDEAAEIEVESALRRTAAVVTNLVTINVGIVREVVIQYDADLSGVVDLESLQLVTEPPMIEAYAAEDGSERVMVECEDGFVLEKGICVRADELKEQSLLKEEKPEEHTGGGYAGETALECEDGYRAENGICVPETDLKEQSKLKEEKEEEHTGGGYAGEAALECEDG
eukprot:CAMPEP_0197024386 /NCGR_PEP_ID=MMETSP1384-20130603/4931_1 /TAXON_ID=29189 /ORGANISM="Ammonia sp." /LENGTH=447 /DNA_ID=CAMNT_0042452759 /DNA_START=131 /DNA_END=1471 /DNA_ORIENTATION=+